MHAGTIAADALEAVRRMAQKLDIGGTQNARIDGPRRVIITSTATAPGLTDGLDHLSALPKNAQIIEEKIGTFAITW